MNQRHVALVGLFKKAIDTERNAQDMYRELAAACDDDELRTVIEGFGRQEAEHERVLSAQYATLRSRFATTA
jgi:rubrerythrin